MNASPKRTRLSGKISRREKEERSPLLPLQLQNFAHSYGYWDNVPWAVVNTDAGLALKALPNDSVDCVVTSPPCYWQIWRSVARDKAAVNSRVHRC